MPMTLEEKNMSYRNGDKSGYDIVGINPTTGVAHTFGGAYEPKLLRISNYQLFIDKNNTSVVTNTALPWNGDGSWTDEHEKVLQYLRNPK